MRHYLTNMNIITKDIAIEAIKLSGRNDIYIDDEPMPNRFKENFIGHYYSIYVDRIGDYSDFWQIYEKLCKSKKWKTYLELTK